MSNSRHRCLSTIIVHQRLQYGLNLGRFAVSGKSKQQIDQLGGSDDRRSMSYCSIEVLLALSVSHAVPPALGRT